MRITVQTKLGNAVYNFEIEEKNDMEALHKAAVLGNPPLFCDNCSNEKVEKFKLQSNKDGESNVYVNVECTECGAKAKLGQYKAGGNFWKRFELYVKKEA